MKIETSLREVNALALELQSGDWPSYRDAAVQTQLLVFFWMWLSCNSSHCL